jgi:surfactin synthase thioesterase subunit
MKYNYLGCEAKVKEESKTLHIGINGVNEWIDIFRIFKPKRIYTRDGSYQSSMHNGAAGLLLEITNDYNFDNYETLKIVGHSKGGSIAAHMAHLIYHVYGHKIDLVCINPYRDMSLSVSREVSNNVRSAKTYIYRNDWLNAIQNIISPYFCVGDVIHDPEPTWNKLTAWADHNKSVYWGD